MNISATLAECVISILSAIITTVLLPLAAQYVAAKIQNQKLQSAVDDIVQCVTTSVDFLEQTMVAQLKAEGKWNSDSQKAVMNQALTTSVNMLSSSTTKWLKANEKDAQEIAKYYIEAYIHSLKGDSTNEAISE